MEALNKVISIKSQLPFLAVFLMILLNISGQSIYWCYLTLPIFLFVIYYNTDILDKNFLLTLAFSLLYPLSIFFNNDIPNSYTIFIGYFVFPPTFYFLGQYLIKKYPSAQTVYFLIFFVCFFLCLIPFLSNVYSVIENGFMSIRTIKLLWNKENAVLNATNLGSYFAINLTLLPLIFSRKKSATEKKYSFLALFLVIISLFSIINMLNRTGLVIFLCSLLVYIILSEKRTNALIVLFILTGIFLILYTFNIEGFRTWFEFSNYYERLTETGIHNEPRLRLWQEAIRVIFIRPFGNNSIMGGNFAHNLWLDVGIKAGLIPMVALLVLTLSVLFDIIQIINNKNNAEFLRLLIAGCGIAFYITFFLEPIIAGYLILFFLYCFICGIITGYKKHVNNQLENISN